MKELDLTFGNQSQIPSDISAKFSTTTEQTDDTFDSVVLVLLVGIVISLAGISYVLRTNPVMFMLVFFVVLLISALAGYLSNAWVDVTTGALSNAVQNFPITEFVMQNYLVVTAVNAFIMLIVFFGTPGREQ